MISQIEPPSVMLETMSPLRILVAEDEEVIHRFMKTALARGFTSSF